jgi:transposase-like protein
MRRPYFRERYAKRYPKAVASRVQGLEDTLGYLHFPGSQHRLIRTTNLLERVL